MGLNANLPSYSVFMFVVAHSQVITSDGDDMIGHGGCCMFFIPSPGILIMVL